MNKSIKALREYKYNISPSGTVVPGGLIIVGKIACVHLEYITVSLSIVMKWNFILVQVL